MVFLRSTTITLVSQLLGFAISAAGGFEGTFASNSGLCPEQLRSFGILLCGQGLRLVGFLTARMSLSAARLHISRNKLLTNAAYSGQNRSVALTNVARMAYACLPFPLEPCVRLGASSVPGGTVYFNAAELGLTAAVVFGFL